MLSLFTWYACDWNFIDGNWSQLVRKNKSNRFSHTLKEKKIFSEVNRFNKLLPWSHLCKPLSLASSNVFPTSNSSTMRMTEFKSYRHGLTKAPSHLILSSKKSLLWGTQREKEKQKDRAYLKRKGEREKLQCSKGTYRVSHSPPSTAECGEGQNICPRTNIHSKQVVTCPEPGSHDLAIEIIEDKKENHSLVQGKQYVTVEYGYSLCIQLFSLFQNMFREGHRPELFYIPAIWYTQVQGAHLIPGLLEGPPTQTYTQNWGLKTNREAQMRACSKN